MSTHALLSPSGAHRWMRCPGSLDLEAREPQSSSFYAREGTAAHMLAAKVLEAGVQTAQFLGADLEVEGQMFRVDHDMVQYVDMYVRKVRECSAGGTLYVEHRVYFGQMIGQSDEEASGTADALVILADELQVHDLKYGRGERVDAWEIATYNGAEQRVPNPQLGCYGLGALAHYMLTHHIARARLVIHQPRLNHISEEVFTVEELLAFGVRLADAAKLALAKSGQLVPGEKQCRWCRAKATCPALREQVLAQVQAEGDEVSMPADDLAGAMAKVDLIEDWCRAVRAKVEENLLAGRAVPGYKLVEGKRGNRRWADAAAAEAAMKAARLKVDEMYERSLMSPTRLEKVLKERGRVWAKLEPLITQSEGRPSVAPESDPRPALATAGLDAMSDLTQETP